MAAKTNTAKESIVSLKIFIVIKFKGLGHFIKKQKFKEMAAGKSGQTEKKKPQLLDSRFSGVMSKLLNVVAAKRRCWRLVRKYP
jgi:hypothetical protein